jgi:hypothetical protein
MCPNFYVHLRISILHEHVADNISDKENPFFPLIEKKQRQ